MCKRRRSSVNNSVQKCFRLLSSLCSIPRYSIHTNRNTVPRMSSFTTVANRDPNLPVIGTDQTLNLTKRFDFTRTIQYWVGVRLGLCAVTFYPHLLPFDNYSSITAQWVNPVLSSTLERSFIKFWENLKASLFVFIWTNSKFVLGQNCLIACYLSFPYIPSLLPNIPFIPFLLRKKIHITFSVHYKMLTCSQQLNWRRHILKILSKGSDRSRLGGRVPTCGGGRRIWGRAGSKVSLIAGHFVSVAQ